MLRPKLLWIRCSRGGKEVVVQFIGLRMKWAGARPRPYKLNVVARFILALWEGGETGLMN